MAILQNPIIIPPTEQKTADKLWILNLTIRAGSVLNPVTVEAKICPFISETGEIVTSKTKKLIIPDLYDLAASDVQVGAAISVFVDAIYKICADQHLFDS